MSISSPYRSDELNVSLPNVLKRLLLFQVYKRLKTSINDTLSGATMCILYRIIINVVKLKPVYSRFCKFYTQDFPCVVNR